MCVYWKLWYHYEVINKGKWDGSAITQICSEVKGLETHAREGEDEVENGIKNLMVLMNSETNHLRYCKHLMRLHIKLEILSH